MPRELTALADGGRIVLIALLGGAKAEINLNEVLRRRLTVTGSTLRPRPIEFKAKVAAQLKSGCGRTSKRPDQTGDSSGFPARRPPKRTR